MKKYLAFLVVAIVVAGGMTSCKALAKSAAKRWAKKKRKEFLTKCNESNAVKLISDSEGFCDCALDVVMEKYPEAEEGLALSIADVIKMTKDCISR